MQGPAIVRINLFVRSIATISDIKMVSGPAECALFAITAIRCLHITHTYTHSLYHRMPLFKIYLHNNI